MDRDAAVLVIAGFGIWVDGEPKVGKIESHLQPIAEAADEVLYVCSGPVSSETDGVTYRPVNHSRWKLLTLLRQFLVAMWLARKRDFDVIVSFSLVPYGMFALVVGALSGTPAHLGIIGSDLDVHAESRYGPAIRWLFRRFDAVTVSGSDYRERLVAMGVPPERIFIVLHPVRSEYAEATLRESPEYDVLWLTRLSSEKDPMLFVDALTELRDRSVDFRAAIVGGGSMEEEVRDAVSERELDDAVDMPGWANSPVEYYRNARIYVLTSEREMLPLSLVEAMLVGVPPVTPALGAIPDVVEDGENGVLLSERTPEALADALETLLTDEDYRSRLAAAAPDVASQLSYEAVGESWEPIFEYVGVGRRAERQN